MRLDLDDPFIAASIRQVAPGRVRLTLDYPDQDRYRDVVLGALRRLLRPANATGSGTPDEDHSE